MRLIWHGQSGLKRTGVNIAGVNYDASVVGGDYNEQLNFAFSKEPGVLLMR